jgi:hypothetical protein
MDGLDEELDDGLELEELGEELDEELEDGLELEELEDGLELEELDDGLELEELEDGLDELDEELEDGLDELDKELELDDGLDEEIVDAVSAKPAGTTGTGTISFLGGRGWHQSLWRGIALYPHGHRFRVECL